MDVIVCVKHVPSVAEVELKVTPDGKDIDKAGMVFDINEWDDYALEEALRIKEKSGGTVTVVTVGGEDSNETLRKCLAKGADNAIRVTDPRINLWDPIIIARILSKVIENVPHDLVLVGVQAADDGYAAVGPALAGFLDIPYATLVKKVEVENGHVRVNRELEGGLEEVVDVELPALLSIQTGINEPRYVSIIGVRRAMRREIKVYNLEELGLSLSEVKADIIEIEKLYRPHVERRAQFIEGSPEVITSKIMEILKARGII